MTERSIAGDDVKSKNNPSFTITESSRKLLKSIEALLAELVSRIDLHPSDEEFYNLYIEFLEKYDFFQHQVITDSEIRIACSAGCSICCCHWVEDVHSFEGIIISRYVADNYSDLNEQIISICREDTEILKSLSMIVDEKTDEYCSDSDEDPYGVPDKYDLLLSCFYQLERPCPLLDGDGRCIVYPVRPLTCRDYINIRNSSACLPDRINEEGESTLIMYYSDRVSEYLEILHRRFDNGNDVMSLRSLVADSFNPL